MFEEIVKKIEEAFTKGVQDVREDVVFIKDRLEKIEQHLFVEKAEEAAPVEIAVPEQPASVTEAPVAVEPVAEVVTAPETVAETATVDAPAAEAPAV